MPSSQVLNSSLDSAKFPCSVANYPSQAIPHGSVGSYRMWANRIAGWMIAITGLTSLTKPVSTCSNYESQIESPLSASFDLCP